MAHGGVSLQTMCAPNPCVMYQAHPWLAVAAIMLDGDFFQAQEAFVDALTARRLVRPFGCARVRFPVGRVVP